MTAGAPALTALLDELDRLRATATPGEWYTDGPGSVSGQWWLLGRETVGKVHTEADAALIVAEHAAVPRLVAAIRSALALADELDGYTTRRGRPAGGSFDNGVNLAQADAASSIRSALAAALGATP